MGEPFMGLVLRAELAELEPLQHRSGTLRVQHKMWFLV